MGDRFRRIEIWSEVAAGSGTRLGVIPAPDLLAALETREVNGEDSLSLEVTVSTAVAALLTKRRVLRVVKIDAADVEMFDEWRISEPGERRQGDATTRIIRAVSPLQDLTNTDPVTTQVTGTKRTFRFELIGVDPATHLATILAAANLNSPYPWAVGTVEPTAAVDVAYDTDTPLSALKKLVEVTGCDLVLRRNGTTSYLIDLLTQQGAAEPVVDVRVGKNLTGIQRTVTEEDQATVVLPRGQYLDPDYGTMRGAGWRVAAIGSDDLTLEDEAGGDGPIAFDDQLNGLAIDVSRLDDGGTTSTVVDSVASTQVVTVTTGHGATFQVGDIVGFRHPTQGALTTLSNPAGLADPTVGRIFKPLDLPDVPGVRNFVKNGAMRAWSGAASSPPDGWVAVGSPTLTRTTDAAFTRYGGKSCRIQAAADGEGLETDWQDFFELEEGEVVARIFSYFAAFYLVTGRVRVEIDLANSFTLGTPTTALGSPLIITVPDPASSLSARAYSDKTNEWVELGVAGVDYRPDPAFGSGLGTGDVTVFVGTNLVTQYRIRVVQDGTTATEFYLDAVMLSKTPDHPPFVERHGGTQLWQAANRYLLDHQAPTIDYLVNVRDRYRLDPTGFPWERFALGGTIRVTDDPLTIGPSLVRVTQLSENLLMAGDVQVGLSTVPRRFTSDIARVDFAPRPVRASEPDTAQVSSAATIASADGAYTADGWRATSLAANVASTDATALSRAPEDVFHLAHTATIRRLVVTVDPGMTIAAGTLTIGVVKQADQSPTIDLTADNSLVVTIDASTLAQRIFSVEVAPGAFQEESGKKLVIAYGTTSDWSAGSVGVAAAIEVQGFSSNANILEGGGPSGLFGGTGAVITDLIDLSTSPSAFLDPVSAVLWVKETGDPPTSTRADYLAFDRVAKLYLSWDATTGRMHLRYLDADTVTTGDYYIAPGVIRNVWRGYFVAWDRSDVVTNTPIIRVLRPEIEGLNAFASLADVPIVEAQAMATGGQATGFTGVIVGSQSAGFVGRAAGIQVWRDRILTTAEALAALRSPGTVQTGDLELWWGPQNVSGSEWNDLSGTGSDADLATVALDTSIGPPGT